MSAAEVPADTGQFLFEATSSNTSFSRRVPGLQLAIDSTSLGEFKSCARKYYYSIVLGYQPRLKSVHLTFGLLIHGGKERYAHGRAKGNSHEESIDLALDWVLRETWNRELKRPWASDHRTKNRLTLVRTLVDYFDRFEHDSLETVILANGKPAVELSFSFDSGITYSSTGERVTFCGHLDELVRLNDGVYVKDIKTTEYTIGPGWFAKFTPDNQFSMYSLAGQVAFKEPCKGLIVDGVQVAVGFSRFERQLVQRDVEQLKEWHRDAGWVIREMERSALEQYWPQNDRACDMYGGCKFRAICARSPGNRQQWLDSDYKRRIWDPLQRRGDI